MDRDELQKKLPSGCWIGERMERPRNPRLANDWAAFLELLGCNEQTGKVMLRRLLSHIAPCTEATLYTLEGRPFLLFDQSSYNCNMVLLGPHGRTVREKFHYNYEHLGQPDKILSDLFHARDTYELDNRECAALLYPVYGFANRIVDESNRRAVASSGNKNARQFRPLGNQLLEAFLNDDNETIAKFRDLAKIKPLASRRDTLGQLVKEGQRRNPDQPGEIIPFPRR